MGKSWELTEDQKKEIQEQQAEIGAQYDPEMLKQLRMLNTEKTVK